MKLYFFKKKKRKKRIFPFQLLEDFREKLLGAAETNIQEHIPCRAGGGNMWGQICGVWFASEKKLRMENVPGVSDGFLSKRSKSGGLKKRGLLKTCCVKRKKKKE